MPVSCGASKSSSRPALMPSARALRMVLSCTLLLLSLLGVPLLTATPAQAAPGDPYDPNVPIAWQVANSPSQLYQTQINSDGTVSFVPEGGTNTAYNSLAFNPLDGYLYATQTRTGVNFLIKLGQGGVIVDNAVVTLPDSSPTVTGNQSFFSGGINPATGVMYVLGTNLGATTMTAVNLAAGTQSTITLSANVVGTADLTFAQGALWTVNAGGDLIRIDPTTGAVTTARTNVLPDATTGATVALYGAGFTLGNGNIVWIDNNSGRVYQVDMTSGTYNTFYMGDGTATGNNDAASSLGGPTDLVIGKCAQSQSPCQYKAGSSTPLTTYPLGQDPATGYVPGQQATYTVSIHNDGPGLSTGSVVTDTLPSGTTFASSSNSTCAVSGSTIECAVGRLAAGETFTFTVTVDVTAGTTATVTNTATVLANEVDPDTADNTDTHTLVPPTPGIDLAKDVLAGSYADVDGDGRRDAGDTIRYQFVVTNSGTVALSPVTVSDPRLSAAGVAVTCPLSSLAPGASMTCTSAAYTITQADVDSNGGLITNTATATGAPPGGLPNVTDTDPATFQTDVTAGLTLTKNADRTALVLGQAISYTFTVSNTGATTLRDVAVRDDRLANLNLSVSCPDTTLAPGESVTCTSSAYVVTQADIDAGRVLNVATAVATSPDDTVVESPPSSASTPTDRGPSPGSGFLAFTGANSLLVLLCALVLIGTGAVLLMVRRRAGLAQNVHIKKVT